MTDLAPSLRPATAGDEPFLRAALAAAREPGFVAAGLPVETARVLALQQADVERRARRHSNPEAEDLVILDGSRPVGRLLLERSAAGDRVVDLALLPAERGRGLGTRLLVSLAGAAHAEGRSLGLSVGHDNRRALALYERLGFVPVGATETHLQLRLSPPG